MSLATPERFGEYASFVMALAAEAGELALSQFGASVARRKEDGSLVTRTDEQIDLLVAERIRSAYPADMVLSEEHETLYDPEVGRTWIIDPVDGTTNFARGLAIWGISIALVQQGMPVVGVIAFPLVRETYSAVAGQGALRNGLPIHTAADEPADDEHLFMECTRTRRRYRIDIPLKSRMLGSAAYHLCKVAEGSALAGSEASPKVWDIAAASLILSEAGGFLRTLQGEPVFPLADRRLDYGRRAWHIIYAARAPSRSGNKVDDSIRVRRELRTFRGPAMTITRIFVIGEQGEAALGSVGDDLVVYLQRYAVTKPVGRVDDNLHIYRATTHGEQEVGFALPTGAIHSAGLLEGGALGWMDPDGVVIRGGMIFGEQEVGRVEGPRALAAAAALLLILLPAEDEAERRSVR